MVLVLNRFLVIKSGIYNFYSRGILILQVPTPQKRLAVKELKNL